MTIFRTAAICSLVAIAPSLINGCKSQDDADADIEFISIASPSADGSMAPHLSVTQSGEAIMSWLEPAEADAHALRFSVLQGDDWATPTTVAADKGWFINWADIPSVIPITAGQWAAHWLVKRPGGTYSYDIALAMSDDGGVNWKKPFAPHTDGTPTEHGFVSMFPWQEGIGVVWLDGRNMVPDASGNRQPEDLQEYGGMSLRFARVTYAGQVLEEGEIDNLVCECCQTDVAIATSGPVIAYRNRTRDEIRDISVTRYVNDDWAEPITVSDDQWRIPGCPVNGPVIASHGDLVAVAWYGAPNREPRIKLAWSEDGAKTFASPIVLDENSPRGRLNIVLLEDGRAIVSWVAKIGDGASQFRMREITTRGALGPVHVIAEGEYSRNAGFPKMVKTENRLIFAWPEPGDPKQVRTAYLPINIRQ